jgi:TPR repeat protein
VKKRFILFMLLPAISLTANTDNFYDRIHALQNNNHNSYSSQPRKVVVRNAPKKVYRYRDSRLQPRNRMVNNRPVIRQRVIPSVNNVPRVRISAADSRKFFYATRAAKSGNPKAQFDLAIMYATGRGVQKNEKIAFNWFHKSARKNYAPAKHYMGISFLQGRGVRKQTELARYWFRLATKQGYRASAVYLSKIDAGRV